MKYRTYGLLILMAFLGFPQTAEAACTPGVPCVSYTPGGTANDEKRDGSEACDGDFMNQIYARAFLEGQRDMMYAQTYIRKPDSTLEYVCFDRYLNNAAAQGARLFSESTRWSGSSVPLNIAFTDGGNPTSINVEVNMGSGHITPNLTAVVSEAMGEFLNNFDHSFLGGSGGMNYTPSDSVSPGAYSCGAMSSIWHIAQCQNLPAAASLFYTFEELASNDIRRLPETCPVNGINADMVRIARNPAPASPAARIDPMLTYLDRSLPAEDDRDCTAPIPTGLQFRVYVMESVSPTQENPSGITRTSRLAPEFVCTNPGCYYHVDVSGSGGSITLSNQSCRRG